MRKTMLVFNDFEMECVSNQKDDDWILSDEEKILIVNHTAGEILEYIKECKCVDLNDVISYFEKKYGLGKKELDDIMDLLEDCEKKGIIKK